MNYQFPPAFLCNEHTHTLGRPRVLDQSVIFFPAEQAYISVIPLQLAIYVTCTIVIMNT